MIRIGTVIWFVMLALLGVGLFQVKYAVQAKERELRKVNRQIAADHEAMRVLEAEWSYLNDPVRLADLARRHTDLAPVMASQMGSFDALPMRPAAAPDALEAAPGEIPETNPAITNPAMPPLVSATEGEAVLTPASATLSTPAADSVVNAQPQPAQVNAVAVEEDDATIRAILQDMQTHQGSDTPPEAGSGKTEPANEGGVE